VGDNLPFEIFPNDANYNARGLYARFDQYEIGATVVANDHGGSGPREVSATNSDFVSDSGTFKATYRPLIAGTYDLFIKLIEDSSLAPVSIQSDAVVAVIIVRIVFLLVHFSFIVFS
jgi:hypothetical protein